MTRVVFLAALLGCATTRTGNVAADSGSSADRIRAELMGSRADADRLDASATEDIEFLTAHTEAFGSREEATQAFALMRKLAGERLRFETSYREALAELDRAQLVENRQSLRVAINALGGDYMRFVDEYVSLHRIVLAVAARANLTAPAMFTVKAK